MPNLRFCSNCDTLMDYIGSDLKCTNCSREEPVKSKSLLNSTVYQTAVTSKIESSTIYDPAIRRTSKMSCVNSECPTHDIGQWGMRTAEGTVIQPDCVMVSYHSKERTNTYICRICKVMFEPN